MKSVRSSHVFGANMTRSSTVCAMASDRLKISLYTTHRARLVDYATPIVGSRDQAEDIVQDAFLKFTPATASAGEIEQPLSYLYRVVRNRALDLLRRRRTETSYLCDAPQSLPLATPSPEETLLHGDDLKRVTQLLGELPNHVRIAVEMYRLGGYTLEEVADYLGLSVATVHRLIRKTLFDIAKQIEA